MGTRRESAKNECGLLPKFRKSVLELVRERRREAGRSVFNPPLSARPGGSEAAGGREKTKTRKHRGPGGPGDRTHTVQGLKGTPVLTQLMIE